jgi:hypothetical protein
MVRNEVSEMLEFLDKYLAVINAVIATASIIILYALFGLLRKKFDKPKSFWIIYWASSLIVLLGTIFLLSIYIKLNYTLAGHAVGINWGYNELLFYGLVYFLAVLGIFYLWYKKGKRPVSHAVIFWVLAIVLSYLLFKASILIIKYFIILKFL